MVMISVEALFDGKNVHLLAEPPVNGRYRVLVTFVSPAQDREHELVDILASFGAWQDDRPIESSLADIYGSRKSRQEPPDL